MDFDLPKKYRTRARSARSTGSSSPKYKTRYNRRRRQQQRAMKNDVIVIDSDSSDNDNNDNVIDLDRKPAAKKMTKDKSDDERKKSADTKECISLLDSDEENEPNHCSGMGFAMGGSSRGMLLLSPGSNKRKRDSEALDRELAEQLQALEDKASKKASPRKEKREMIKSNDGKAILAVQEIIALVKTAKEKYIDKNADLQRHLSSTPAVAAAAGGAATANATQSIEAVTIDDMVYFAKNMLDKQQEFIQNNVSGYIDIGYHYTDQRNMENIRTHGLLTKAERDTNKVKAAPKGSVFGDGIYTANNGTCFSNFGTTGLLCARLKGKVVRAAYQLPYNQHSTVDAHTIVGDKFTGIAAGKQVDNEGWPIDDSYHEIVLRHSSQCLPMIKFDRQLRSHKDGKECIRFIKKELKGILKLFNKGLKPTDLRDAPFIVKPPPRPAHILPHAAQALRTAALPASMNNHAALLASALPGISAAPTMATMPVMGAPAPPNGSASWLTGLSSIFANNSTVPTNATMPPPTIGAATAPHPTISHAAAGSTSSTIPVRTRRAFTSSVATGSAASRGGQTLTYTAPQALTMGIPLNALVAPSSSCNMKDKCVICHERLKKNPCVTLRACHHTFHYDCVQLAFKSKPACPVCRVAVGSPQGKSPSGTMTISSSSIRCSGFQEDSFIISYNMPPSIQLAYHDNPGTRHGGKIANAYLPNNAEGQALLKRLKFAFMHGLSFNVGTSVTTQQPNQCTWTSVHHKTSPTGGVRAFGYPDPNYFVNCNEELDALNVPSATSLDDDGKEKGKKGSS